MPVRSIRKARAHKRSVILAVVLTLVLAGILSVAILRLNRENRLLLNNQAALEESLKEEQARKESLEEREGKGLSKEELEQIARDRYHLVYPDEIILTPEE